MWILIPTLLVFLASLVVVIVFAVKLLTGPVQTTNDYYADVRDGRYVAAYGQLCSPLQRRISQSDFIDIQRSDNQSKGRISSYDFHSFHIENSIATVTGTVERGGSSYDARVGLRKESGDWKVCSVSER